MAGAAFFDLDRTLLKGASGPIISEALGAAGLAPERGVPGQSLLYRAYDLVGETLPSMALARGAARLARGQSVEVVRHVGKQAADRLEEIVAPYAHAIIEEHRKANRPVILATTTPHDLVAPLAERLGFDDVIATRYAEKDGTYTGGLDGEFVWATGKLAAVRRWAKGNGINLADSYAYSDSFYDLPLLLAVGHPHAVNPDPRLRAVATLRRIPVIFLDVPPGVPKLGPFEPFDLVRLLSRPELVPYARFDFDGLDNIPDDGPAIIVANHRSYFDTVAMGLTVIRAGRAPRFLGKKEVFDAPIIGPLAKAMGGIRVDRGSSTAAEPLRQAARTLDAGEVVVVMPQGTIPRGAEFFNPKLKGKTGAARLAAMTKAPVIPIGLWGTEQVWPRSARIPNVTNVLHPPKIQVRVGGPVKLGYDDDAAIDTQRIMDAIVDLLPLEARRKKKPTADEIARATPANAKPKS
jgi:putative phosphoserine phosphatase/1-acylglycerol-3-phosphate O-acyltransferase